MVPAAPDEGYAHTRGHTAIHLRLTRHFAPRRHAAFWIVGLLGIGGAAVAGCAATMMTVQTVTDAPLGDPSPSKGLRRQSGAEAPSSLVTRVELGRSISGRAVTMDVFGSGPDAVLIVGGIHGDEPTGAEVTGELARFLHAHPELLAGHTVGILAQANPDGLLRGTRANARGVDLNRNFPSRDWRRARAGELSHGPAAGSEPETLAVISAIRIIKPARIIDVHSIGHGYHCNNYDGAARHLAELLSSFNGYPVAADMGYSTPGALGCWAGIELDIPTITLEFPRALNRRDCWRDNAGALLAFIGAGNDNSVRDLELQARSQ